MQYKKFTLFFQLIIIFNISLAQNAPNIKTFNSPISFPIYLSGNYGELRSGHFHAGIDIKTQGVKGKEIFSVKEGYISRIKISATGYGKTLYINHPNGYTSVYGHLNNFNSEISDFIKSKQYRNNEFEINYFPAPTDFIVKKGELIAYSGNTGSSKGPHLHFEIRDSKSQIPLNPLLFNFDIKDNIPPKFYAIHFYPLSDSSLINNQNKQTSYILKKLGEKYIITDTNKLLLSGNIGIGIETNDFLNGSRNKCGIYSLELKINNQKIYSHVIDNISFNETGYIKSHIDYAKKIKSKKAVQKLFVAPNNKLSIYKSLKNNGIYNFIKDSTYEIDLMASDANGNKSKVAIQAEGNSFLKTISSNNNLSSRIFMNWETENYFENNEIKISIPKNALYDTLYFNYSSSEKKENTYSKIHHVHYATTPIQKKSSISIKIENLPDKYKGKAFIAYIDEENKIENIGGEVINNYIVSNAKNFGDYTVMIDTINPTIEPLIKNNDLLDAGEINFTIIDDLSGIKSYNGYIDNKWALFEYDKKNDLLFYTFDKERIKKNTEHEVELFVIDNTGNISTYYTNFYW
jgi:hypothetical protein